MTITREIDGKTFTFKLSRTELWEAFIEEQHICDIEDVHSEIFDTHGAEDFKDYFGITQEQAEKHIEEIAGMKRKYQDGGEDWIWAARDAIMYYADDIRDEAEQEATA